MQKIKISVVSYLNSFPFLDGLERSEIIHKIDLQRDIPSVCAQKLMNEKVDVGLIPVAVLPQLKQKFIISDYCIGASGAVGSVMLYSNVPLKEIKSVLLDYQSRTSIALVKILAEKFWNISPQWLAAQPNYENQIGGTTAAVIIGDRTFGLEKIYQYSYDLAEEWTKFTGLPFVFACWVSNHPLPSTFIDEFNRALENGLENRPALIEKLKKSNQFATDIEKYLTQNIDYQYDATKKKALEVFLSYLSNFVE